MAALVFIQDTQTAVNNMGIVFGHLYHATDTNNTYYDNVNNNRVSLTNVQYVNSYSDLTALTPTMPKNTLFVITTTGLFYIYNHDNIWQQVMDSYEIPSYLMPTDSLIPMTLTKDGISIAPRTLLKCVYNDNGESLDYLVNFKDASTTQRGTIILYDNYDSTATNSSPTSNALNKLYQYITGIGFKAADSNKLNGLDATRYLQYTDPASPNQPGLFDKSVTAPTGTTRINYSGYFYATRTYNAVYNDYAEYFERNKDEDLQPGDVIMKDPDGDYGKAQLPYDKRVVGVYSDEYGYIVGGNGNDKDEEDFIPVGMAGRVHVKVIGKVEIGDLLVSSYLPGIAMKCENYIPGTVIGKCIEAKDTETIGKVRMLILNA